MTIATIAQMRRHLAGVRQSARTIGLVPTMGALHPGHGALLDRAGVECDHVVATIFVNPIQFDRREDYAAYSLNLDDDIAFCAARGVDTVFAPSPTEMYPEPSQTFIEVTVVSEEMEGRFRPGHFRGVATVVAKLFHIVPADRAYFGEKDAQQLAVIRRMVLDLNFPTEIVPVATVREADGLAWSSRNRRLSPEERRVAPALYQALALAQARLAAGCRCAAEIRRAALDRLAQEPRVRVEYVEVADAVTMTPVLEVSSPVRIVAAVWLGNTRLIDNVLFTI
jgi:pantoate--beta-alanine ligase